MAMEAGLESARTVPAALSAPLVGLMVNTETLLELIFAT